MKKLIVVVLLAACGPKGPFPAADPLRPQPSKVEAGTVEVAPVGPPPDCTALAPAQGDAAIPYKDRQEDAARATYKEALQLLKGSEDPAYPGGPPADAAQQELFVQAVKKFQVGLAEDPYNAYITYNLAAAYSRINKAQCTINLLQRLAAIKSWPSRQKDATDCVNRLLGKGSWSGRADPDFDGMRADDRFREVVKTLTK